MRMRLMFHGNGLGLRRAAAIVALTGVMLVPAWGKAQPAEQWRARFVDHVTDADSYDATRTSISTPASGVSWIVYSDGPQEGGGFDLKLARGPLRDGTFSRESIDPGDPEVAGYASLSMDSGGRANVAYSSGWLYGTGILKYAHRQRRAWQIDVVDPNQGVWGDTSLALDTNDRPYIAYSTLSGQLRLATRNQTGWTTELVSAEHVQALNLALDSTGLPRIAYVAGTGDAFTLRMATFDGASWAFETVARVSSQGMEFGVGLALDSRDEENIVFSVLEPDRGMAFARRVASGWDVRVLEGDLWQPALTVDTVDTVHVTFYDATRGALVYGRRAVGGEWSFETVEDDPSPYVRIGRQPSISVDDQGRVHLSYYHGDVVKGTKLRYAVSERATP